MKEMKAKVMNEKEYKKAAQKERRIDEIALVGSMAAALMALLWAAALVWKRQIGADANALSTALLAALIWSSIFLVAMLWELLEGQPLRILLWGAPFVLCVFAAAVGAIFMEAWTMPEVIGYVSALLSAAGVSTVIGKVADERIG